MDKRIIGMTYLAEKEDGTLSHNMEGDIDDKFTDMISMLHKLIGNEKGDDVENIIFDLFSAYEERAYIVGFKNGFNLNNEIKALN